MKPLISIIIIVFIGACKPAKKTQVTTTQLHVIQRIDTAGKHIYIKLKPVSPIRSSLPNGHRPGDTIPVLKNYFIRN